MDDNFKIGNCTKQHIKARAESVLKHYGVELIRGKGLCPFHDDKTPSFIARLDKKGELFWKCQSCGVRGGDVFSFVAQKEGLDITKGALNAKENFIEVFKLAASACGLGYMLDPNAPKIEPPIKPIAPNCTNCTKEDEPPHYLNDATKRMREQGEQTNLFTFLCRYWDEDAVKAVFSLYSVGLGMNINREKNWELIPMPTTLQRCNKCSAFPYIDEEGNTHAIKIIPYPVTDHHRIKTYPNAQMIFHKPESNKGVYFGTHLLATFPNKPLAIVESEKTAIIGTLIKPSFIWVAVGGFDYFNPDSEKQRAKLDRLKGRCLHIFPDVDKLTQWKERADKIREQGFNVVFRDEVIKMFAPNSGIDIGDVIVWEQERIKERLKQLNNEL